MRVYWASFLKWLGAIAGSGGVAIGSYFAYLAFIGAITITGFSGDQICAGTEADPCYGYINLTANEDVFLYPVGYEPFGRDTTFEFDKKVKDWKLQRKWGNGWINVPMDKPCTGTWCGAPDNTGKVSYSWVLRKGKPYEIRIVGFKEKPSDTIKWSAFDGKVDPYWLGDRWVDYTPYSETVDLGEGKKSMDLFSAQEFVFEDDVWKHKDEARSLKGTDYFPVRLLDDKVGDMVYVDWNCTTVRLKAKLVDSKALSLKDVDIPIKKDGLQVFSVRLSDIGVESGIIDLVFPEDAVRNNCEIVGHNWSVGFNSTVDTVMVSNTTFYDGVIADSAPTTAYGTNTYINTQYDTNNDVSACQRVRLSDIIGTGKTITNYSQTHTLLVANGNTSVEMRRMDVAWNNGNGVNQKMNWRYPNAEYEALGEKWTTTETTNSIINSNLTGDVMNRWEYEGASCEPCGGVRVTMEYITSVVQAQYDATGNVSWCSNMTNQHTGGARPKIDISSSESGNVVIHVEYSDAPPANNAPTCAPDNMNITVNEDTGNYVIYGNITTNCTDVDNDALYVSKLSQSGDGGIFAVNNYDEINFSTEANESGTTVVVINVSDGIGGDALVSAQVIVTGINDQPWWNETFNPFTPFEAYNDSNWQPLHQAGNFFDGDWDTYSEPSADNAYIYMNFTKQNNTGYARWDIKAGEPAGFNFYNISIPDECFIAYPDRIELQLNSKTGTNDFPVYCGNSTAWVFIQDITAALTRTYESRLLTFKNIYEDFGSDVMLLDELFINQSWWDVESSDNHLPFNCTAWSGNDSVVTNAFYNGSLMISSVANDNYETSINLNCSDSGWLSEVLPVYVDILRVPDATFAFQMPEDMRAGNLFSETINISYAVDAATTARLWYKTNSTDEENVVFVNGSLQYSNYTSDDIIVTSNGTDYYFQVDEHNIMPATYNLDEDVMEAADYQTYDLDMDTEYVKGEFLNMHPDALYHFFEIQALNQSATDQGLRLYYCNSTYTSGIVETDLNCVLFNSLFGIDSVNHTHTAQSNHSTTGMGISQGKIGDIVVTPTSYVLMRGRLLDGWDIYYAPDISRTGAWQYSTTNGAVWNELSGTVNAHVHWWTAFDTFYYFAEFCDEGGCVNNSEISEGLELDPQPPNTPIIDSPYAAFWTQNITINWTDFSSPTGQELAFFNVTLVSSSDRSWLYTIYPVTNVSQFEWNTTEYADGNYTVRVEACDNLTLCSYGYSDSFGIDNILPDIQSVILNFSGYANYTNESMFCEVQVGEGGGIDMIVMKSSTDNITEAVELFSLPDAGLLVANLTSFEINDSNYTKNEHLWCQARAFDGFAYSDWLNSTSLKVENYPPKIFLPMLFWFEEDEGEIIRNHTSWAEDLDVLEGADDINWSYTSYGHEDVINLSVEDERFNVNDTEFNPALFITYANVSNSSFSIEWTVIDDESASDTMIANYGINPVNDEPWWDIQFGASLGTYELNDTGYIFIRNVSEIFRDVEDDQTPYIIYSLPSLTLTALEGYVFYSDGSNADNVNITIYDNLTSRSTLIDTYGPLGFENYWSTTEPYATLGGNYIIRVTNGTDYGEAYGIWEEGIEQINLTINITGTPPYLPLPNLFIPTNNTAITCLLYANFELYCNGSTKYEEVSININATDSGSNSETALMTIIFNDTKSPSWSGNITNPLSPTIYRVVGIEANMTWEDLFLDSVYLNWNGTDIPLAVAMNETSGVFSVNITISLEDEGNLTYYWYANDSNGNMNITDNFTMIFTFGASMNLTFGNNISNLQFAVNVSDYNWTTGNVTSSHNYTAVNQTGVNPAFILHNNGTYLGNVTASLENWTISWLYCNNGNNSFNSTRILYDENVSLGVMDSGDFWDVFCWSYYDNADREENFSLLWFMEDVL